MINWEALKQKLDTFELGEPFHHCIVDDFFEVDFARELEADFPHYDAPEWYVYQNLIEHKKTFNHWEKFPAATYRAFSLLQSAQMTDLLSTTLGKQAVGDYGLNGGGWHIHGDGGTLNPHLDYSIHPKLGLERVLNIIVYLSSELRDEHGGHLGLWTHDDASASPGVLAKEVESRFNRAIVFNTTQNSWHGLSRVLTLPEGVFRKSIAVYYLCAPDPNASQRGRALFAPREDQKNDQRVIDTIKLRSSIATSNIVYRQ